MNRRDAETQRRGEEKFFPSVPLRLCGENVWLLWQLADSAFPTGGFAHSGGLEAAWQHRELRGGDELADYLRAALTQLTHGALPFVHATHSRAGDFAEVDWRCDAFTPNHVTNRASRLQGQSLLASTEKIFDQAELTAFRYLCICRRRAAKGFATLGTVTGLCAFERTPYSEADCAAKAPTLNHCSSFLM